MLASPPSMHIPDGFLSLAVSLGLWLVSLGAVALALRRVNQSLGERQVPLMGVLAACIFAGQMLNFAVAGGTSGHLMGAALATILLGPWAAILIMTCVVGVQALIFQDGGLLALGANIFNMGVLGTAVSYGVHQALRRWFGKNGWLVSGFASAWTSVFVVSLAVALQLAISGTSPADLAIPAMAGVHMLIGIGEGLITVGALSFLRAARRDLVEEGVAPVQNRRAIIVAGLLVALALAAAAPLASTNPDGLEWVAEQQQFLEKAQTPLFELIPDYVMPGIGNEALATIVSGIVGALIVFGVAAATAIARRGGPRPTV